MKKTFNGTAKWIIVAIATLTVAYNTVATHVIAKNEMKHIIKAVEKMDKKVDNVVNLLIEHITKSK